MITAEEYVVSVLQGLPYPVTLGKGSVLTTVPYIQVWHISDSILNTTLNGQVCYQSTLVRIEYETNTGADAIGVGNAIRSLLVAPIVILQEGQSITNPVTGQQGTVAPPPGGNLSWFLVHVCLARIPENS
jgi:hypothetical protein